MFDPEKPLKNEISQINSWTNLAYRYAKRDLSIAVIWALHRLQQQKAEIMRANDILLDHKNCFKRISKLERHLTRLKSVFEANKRFCDLFHNDKKTVDKKELPSPAEPSEESGETDPS